MPEVVPRPRLASAVRHAMQYNPIAVLLGPRQCGKTTLARELAKDSGATFFDLETSADQARLQMPETVLGGLSGLVVIDEVQRMPGLFTVLRPLVDKPGLKARFLLLGSASPELVKGVSESLAGRVGFVDMSGFEICDVGSEGQNRLWLRGGFPRSFLAGSDTESYQWRQDFIRTFLERDVPQLGLRIPAAALMRFWTMLAHYHGQIWNGSEIARALGVSAKTVRDYLDILTGAFVLRQLQPWHENIGKRQYKAPKVYVRDSGVLHALLGIEKWLDLFGHPKYGSSWEGFALEQILTCTGTRQAFYWATHGGAELDLMLIRGGKRYGVEFKCADAPGMTKSLHIAMDDLGLERVWIVYPGQAQYDLAPRVRVCPLRDCISELAAL